MLRIIKDAVLLAALEDRPHRVPGPSIDRRVQDHVHLRQVTIFDGSWIRQRLDREALREMQAIVAWGVREGADKPLDLAGERGEHHTMCVHDPLYTT